MAHQLALTLVYQPIICSFAARHVAWHEALARHQGPDGKLVSVWPFIASGGEAAEHAIDLATPSLLTRDLCAHQSLRATLNVAPSSLLSRDWQKAVSPLLARADLRARLTIEVTERGALSADTCEVLRDFQNAGVCVALDDVAPGLLTTLQGLSLQPDVVKIDKSVIADFLRGEASGLRAIVTYADDRAAAVVAEGVENATSYFRIASAGIRYQQGYFHGRPAKLL